MALGGDFFHTGENRLTNGALRTRLVAGLGAGGRLLRHVNDGVAGGSDCIGLGCIANCAGVGLNAGALTGGSGCDLALIPAVALGGNHFLCLNDRVADRAVLARGLAGLGAGGCLYFVNDLGVTLGRDLSLRNDDCVADGAVLALGLAGFGAGRSLCCVNDLGMALGGNLSLCNDDRVADGAVLALSLAGLGAGSLDCRVNDHGVSLGGDGLAVCDLFVTILAVGIAGVAILSAGGVLGITELRILVCARRAAPDAVDIVDNIASLGGLRLDIGAVSIVQLGRRDGDLVCRHVGTLLRVLIRLGLRARGTLLVVDTGTAAGADVRTAGGGVDAAVGGQRTVDVHLRIDKVCFCAVIMLSGGI